MNLVILKGDITTYNGDAIVNAANKSLLGGGGVDGAIHRAAGQQLLKVCKKLGGCEVGQAKITPGFNLKNVRYIIHTVGPVYRVDRADECAVKLADCYKNSLQLAKDEGIESLAFPCISTGAYGYPKDQAATVALEAISVFFKTHRRASFCIREVAIVCFDPESYVLYEQKSATLFA